MYVKKKIAKTDCNFNLGILDIGIEMQKFNLYYVSVQCHPCHWYASTPSDDGLSTIELWNVNVLFIDDVFQNLAANALHY